jgi:hypothetical protein
MDQGIPRLVKSILNGVEKYPEWRDRRVSDMVEISESVGTRRKRVSYEEELREQVK